MKKNIIIFAAGIFFALVAGLAIKKLELSDRLEGLYGKVRTKMVDRKFNSAPKATEGSMLSSFEGPDDFKKWDLIEAVVEASTEHAVDGKYSAKVEFSGGKQVSSIRLDKYFEQPGVIRDWSGYEGIAFTIFNPQPQGERIILQIKDNNDRKIKQDLFIDGNSQGEFEIEMARLRHSLDIFNIKEFTLFLWQPNQNKIFYLDNVRLLPYGTRDKKTILLPELFEEPGQAYATGDYFDFSRNKAKWEKQNASGGSHVDFGVYLDNELDVDFEKLPFSAGVPFPRGQLKQVGDVGVYNEQGEPILFQARPLCRWGDGSIKWLQFDVLEDVGAGSRKNLSVRYPGFKGGPAESSLRLQENKSTIEVVTDTIKFIVKKQNFNLFDKLWLDKNQDGIYTEDELLTQGVDLSLWFRGSAYLSSGDADCKVTIEEKGPVKTTIKAEGWFVNSAGKKFCKYVVRIQAFAGSGIVRVYHTFIYTGYPENKYHYLYNGKSLPSNEVIEAVTLDMPFNSSGENVVSFAADKQVLQVKGGSDVSFFQENFDTFNVEKDGRTVHVGKRMDGWLDVSDANRGVSVGVKNYWQQYPKEVYFDKKNKKIVLSLWPKRFGALDLKTTQEAHGTESVARGSAFGLAKTHEMVFYFHGGDYKESKVKNVMSGVLEPLLIRVDPRWVDDTAALGRLYPYSPKVFGPAEDTLDRLFDWAQSQKETFNWYGMIDYGDTLSWYRKDGYDENDAHDDWGWHPTGRWGWFNCEAAGTHTGPLLLYLRSGKAKYFKFGEDLTWHLMDIDTCHYNTVANDKRLKGKIPDDYSQPGSMHRHNGNHWGDRNEEATHTNLTGILYYYYLTGNERAFDVAKEIGEFFLRSPVTYFQHPDIAPQRGIANIFWGTIMLYEATGDKRFKDVADKWVDVFYKGQNNNGGWQETYNPVEKRWDGDPRSDFMTCYTLPGLIEYHKITRNKAVKEMIIKGVKYLRNDEYKHAFDSLAYAFWLTGDRKFQEEGIRRLDHLVSHQNRSEDPIMQGMIYQKAYYARPAEFLYSTPYIFEVLASKVTKEKTE